MSIILLLVKAVVMVVVGFAMVLGAAAYVSGAPATEDAGLCKAAMPQACVFMIL